MRQKRWRLRPRMPEDGFGRLSTRQQRFPRLPAWFLQLLYNRGVTLDGNLSRLQGFLAADSRLAHDPFLLPDMEVAVTRIQQAIAAGEVMAVYGDFDADGITATALLVETLTALGGHVLAYIPHRADEGYGLNVAALTELRRQGVSLVITVDCGTTSRQEVAEGRSLGLDIVVTDHHYPPSALDGHLPDPPAKPWRAGAVRPSASALGGKPLALVNPKLPQSKYPFADLSGVGVAFKLVQGLLAEPRLRARLSDGAYGALFELVALGTVTDMAPLCGENRYLVKQGLVAINAPEAHKESQRPGLRELMRQAGIAPGEVDSEAIGYVLGPRLNAAGRIDHALAGYQLLITRSLEEAARLAAHLEERNAERQERTARSVERARQEVLAGDVARPLYLVKGHDYGVGIIGLVASRICDEFYRPAVVVELGDEESRGSMRSIPEFNVMAALEACHDLVLRYGGHAQAAGFTIGNDKLPQLEARLVELAAQRLEDVELHPAIDIDAAVPPRALTQGGVDLIRQLEPFGRGNPVPTFLGMDFRVIEARAVGARGEHLQLKLREGPGEKSSAVWKGIGFGLGEMAEHLPPWVDIVYSLGVDDFPGYEALELHVHDLADASHRRFRPSP